MDAINPNSITRRQSSYRRSQSASWLGRSIETLCFAFRMLRYRLSCHFLCQLGLLRFIFSVLRRFRPIFKLNNFLVVTQAREVREVLERFDDFTLGEAINPGMPWGNFLMTVDWRQRHAEERKWLQDAVDPGDSAKIGAIVIAECQRAIRAANGRIDVVSELLEPIVVEIAKQYFGVPPLAKNIAQMAQAMRDLAGIIMVQPPVGSRPWSRSRDNISKITALVLNQLAAAKAAAPLAGPVPSVGNQNLLTRLANRLGTPGAPNWFDEDWIRRYLTGLLAAGGATIVRAAAGAIDQILARPDALREARTVARDVDQAMAHANQPDVDALRCKLRHFVYEALRFRPMLPLLLRDTPHDTVIAYGTTKARVVRAGTRVLVPPLSAMFDAEAVPDPSRFDESRPFDQYLHFGFGPRHCFGQYIAEIALLEVFRSLLVLKDLSRATGAQGQLRFEGPVAAGLVVTFDSGLPPGSGGP